MPENLEFRQGSWWARKKFDGKTRRKKLHTTQKPTARTRRDRWIEEIRSGEWDRSRAPQWTFEQAAERFTREHFPNLKPTTARRYDTSLIFLTKHFYGEALDDIKSAKLLEFEQARRQTGVSNSTILHDLRCMSVVYSCAEEWEWVESNPVKAFIRSRKKKNGLNESPPRRRYLEIGEETHVIENASIIMCPLIEFAIDTGLRRAEQFRLPKTSINLQAFELTVPADISKSGRERTIPLLPRAHAIATAYMAANDAPALFINKYGDPYSISSPSIWEGLQKAARRAGVTNLRWHDLRRTSACRLHQDHKLSKDLVGLWLGHAASNVTDRHYAFTEIRQLHEALAVSPFLQMKNAPNCAPKNLSHII